MKAEYDFSESRKNPYASRLTRQVTIRLDEPTIEYFKQLADESGIGYQSLIQPVSVRLRRAEEKAGPAVEVMMQEGKDDEKEQAREWQQDSRFRSSFGRRASCVVRRASGLESINGQVQALIL